MSAQVYDFRPFQSAKKYARQAGVSAAPAMKRIREAQQHGDSGALIAGEMRELAWSVRNGHTPSPGGAA